MSIAPVPRSLAAVLIAWLCVMALPAAAQGFPTRPINLVVTVPAGGSIDAVARLIAADLSPAVGQPVVVVNRAGAGGNVAGEFVAKSAPDGHTLLMFSSSTLVLNPHVYASMPFDSERSFTPIVLPARQNLILAVHPKLAVNTVKELIEVLKANPDKLNYSSSGNGTLPHLAGVLFGQLTGTSSTHIPFSGIAPAMNALLSGQVDYMFDSASSIPHVNAGKVKALAVIGPRRLASLPNVPTLTDIGYGDLAVSNGWYGIVGAVGTPPDVVTKLSAEIQRIMRQPAVMEKVSAMGLENGPGGPDELARLIREDMRRLAPIVKAAKVTMQ